MKKLMFALAAVSAGAAFAAGEITSKNIVGYTETDTDSDNNFKIVPFHTLGYNTADIQDIRIRGDESIGWGSETFAIWEGVPDVVAGSEFFYYDPSMDPEKKATDYYWGDESGYKANYSVAAGQGVVINCAADLDLQTSGEVPAEKVEFTSIADNNFTGNPFPATLSIQNIKITADDMSGIGWGSETFAIWEGVPDVVAGSEFFYYDPSMDPEKKATDYYWGDESGYKANYSIPANQGVVINCAEGLTISIEPPYSL